MEAYSPNAQWLVENSEVQGLGLKIFVRRKYNNADNGSSFLTEVLLLPEGRSRSAVETESSSFHIMLQKLLYWLESLEKVGVPSKWATLEISYTESRESSEVIEAFKLTVFGRSRFRPSYKLEFDGPIVSREKVIQNLVYIFGNKR